MIFDEFFGFFNGRIEKTINNKEEEKQERTKAREREREPFTHG